MKKENSKLSGYMLIAVFVVPLLIAVTMYSLRNDLPTISTVSHGELIHPAEPIQEIQIATANDQMLSLEDLKGKWTYLAYSPHGCDLTCEAILFKLRQTKLATGREINRIQSALLIDSKELASDIAARNQRTSVGQLIKLELESAPGVNRSLVPGTIYLLDPLGNMMMQYDDTATSKGMLKDIKKLLKISNIG